jgi:hypothetical protein
MPESTHLAEALEGLFAPPDVYWFVSYPAAVTGLTVEQAACAPGPRFNSIWGVTLHLTICQQFAAAVLRRETIDVNAFLAANHALAICVAGLPDEVLEQPLPYVEMKGYQYIQGHLAHNSNHLCEMVDIRHMQGLWLEKT